MAASEGSISPDRASIGERCRMCHTFVHAEVNSLESAFHYSESSSCTECHSFHDTKIIRAAGIEFQFDYDDADLPDHCQSCHDQPQSAFRLSIGHREAASVYHQDNRFLKGVTPSDACLYCHSSDAVRTPDVKLSEDPPKFNPSAGHRYGIGMIAGKSAGGYSERFPADSSVRLIEGRIECQSCHRLTAENSHLLAGTGQGGDLCLACHIRNIG